MDGTGVRRDGESSGRTLIHRERVDHAAGALHELVSDERRRDLDPAEALGRRGDPTGRDPCGGPARSAAGQTAGPEDQVDRRARIAVCVAGLRDGLEVNGIRPPVYVVVAVEDQVDVAVREDVLDLIVRAIDRTEKRESRRGWVVAHAMEVDDDPSGRGIRVRRGELRVRPSANRRGAGDAVAALHRPVYAVALNEPIRAEIQRDEERVAPGERIRPLVPR